MRNNIRVIDRDIPRKTVLNLAAGQMFKYPKSSNDQNVYMRVGNVAGFHTVVLLATGMYYNDFNVDKEIEVVDSVNITSPIV